MSRPPSVRLPRHLGLIPDGNRRWALARGLQKHEGYAHGITPGLVLFEHCRALGIEEVSVYGFTQDNTRRPAEQKSSFSQACVDFAQQMVLRGAALRVIGDDSSPQFPAELKPFTHRHGTGMKVNLLVNYGWEWDLDGLRLGALRSEGISRVELIIRWGGGRRLSGFLPAQSAYADIFVIDEYWPDFKMAHLYDALGWFARQDATLGG
jgi:undecaprenyl diphosphate synthase